MTGTPATTTVPTAGQRLGYVLGRTLPAEFHRWVIADTTGPGATRRYATRCLIPLIPILTALLLIPGPGSSAPAWSCCCSCPSCTSSSP
ncbi:MULTISPECIES: DUF5313 family protein [Rhodococcus]|uniref:DUF5313 family protein n=1 Tax=Rhodococcus sp. ZPP TaxID=2749906 RepID=UPI001FCDAED9|nr:MULTISPECIES: DUF5313 family protein [Rhodococcus]